MEAGELENLSVEVYVSEQLSESLRSVQRRAERQGSSSSQDSRTPRQAHVPLQQLVIGPKRVRFTYVPISSEDHLIDVKFCNETIKGSLSNFILFSLSYSTFNVHSASF